MHLLNNKFNTDHFISVTEPLFYFGIDKSKSMTRNLSIHLSSGRIKNYFEYSLKQNPKDLSCHLQRIKFTLHEKNEQDFFAALCDLFIILGHQGLSLRNRLFLYAEQKLAQEQVDILAPYLTDKNMSNDLDFLPEHCFFKKETIEFITLSATKDDSSREVEDTLQTIESYIENSQFDSAENFILKHLAGDPENEPLTIKLINLYKALNSTDKFNQAYEQFSNCLLTSRHWDEAHNYFLQNNSKKIT